MDHEEFVRRVKTAMGEPSKSRPEDAVAELRALLEDLGPAIKTGVNEWHQKQVLSLLVATLDEPDTVEECRTAWGELIRFNQLALTYWHKALASANEDFARWRDTHPDPR